MPKHWTVQCVELILNAVAIGKFRAWFAIFLTVGSGSYLWKVSFVAPSTLNKFVETIIGFVLGTALGTVITFVFGTSQSSQDKTKIMANGGNNETP